MIETHKKLIAVISILFFLSVLLCCGIYTLVDNMAGKAIKDSVIAPATATVETSGSPEKAVIPKVTVYIFKPDTYTSGKDFEAGSYDIEALSGKGNVYSTNGFNDIMSPMEDAYYTRVNAKVALPQGTTLTVMGVTVRLVRVLD